MLNCNRILLTGGNGLLGTELQKHLRCDAPSHDRFDITEPIMYPHDYYDLIIHCAGYTDVRKAEIDKKSCYEANVRGTENLARYFSETPFVYISSEYARNPVNFYGETKRAGEMAVEAYCYNYFIMRTLFKIRPFPYEKAFFDQYTQGDYVDVIAKLIVKEIMDWNHRSKMKYIGTGRKTILQLAEQTKPTIAGCSARLVEGVTLPLDYE